MTEEFNLKKYFIGSIDLSKVDPVYAMTKENLIKCNLEAQKQTNEALISLFETLTRGGELHAPAFLKTPYLFQSGKEMMTGQGVKMFLENGTEEEKRHFKQYGKPWIEDNKEQLEVMGFYEKLKNVVDNKE